MECPFVVDQWVVRVRKGRAWGHAKNNLHKEPEIGQPVRIASIFPGDDGTDTAIYLTLKGFDERLWMEWKLFRPLQDKPEKADISELKKLTNPANHKVKEDA